MSGYDNRSKPGYAGDSHPDHVKGRPIISYDAAHGTHTYVRRVESRVATAYKHPISQVKVDPSMMNHGRPREVEELITQILDEVNGPPGLATSPNPGPNWGRHTSPVKVYSARDYGTEFYPGSLPLKSKISRDQGDFCDRGDRSSGHIYDQLPQRDYDIPNNGYLDQSHMKAKAPRAYEAPNQWDRYSKHPVDDPWSQYKSPAKVENLKDYEAPRTQWSDSSIKSHAPGDREVCKNQWDKSTGPVYDDLSPKNQSAEVLRGSSVGRPKSPDSYDVPSNRWDRLSSYDRPPTNGNAGGAPKTFGTSLSNHNYGVPNNHLDKSSKLSHDHPLTNGNISGVPNSRWGNSMLKPESPTGYGASNNQLGRSSSPMQDHSPPTKNTEGVLGIPSNRWGNTLMKPQSPKHHGVPNNQWDRPSSPVHDHPSPTKNIAAPSVPSSRWSLKGHGVPDNQQDRSSSPDHDHPPPTKNTGGEYGVPRSRLGNSLMKPQSPKDHGVPNHQGGKSSSVVHDHPPPTINTSGVPSSRWDNSVMKPQFQRDHGVPHNQWDKTSSLGHDHQLPPDNTSTGGASSVPSTRWGNPLMKPQSSRDHGVPNNQWNRPSSPVRDPPPPTKNTGGVSVVPSSRWGNSLVNPQSPKDHGAPMDQWDRSSSPGHNPPPPIKITGGVSRWGNPLVNPQSPKDNGVPKNNWDKSSNLSHEHPPLTYNTEGVPNDQWGNSFVKPQPLKDNHGVSNHQRDRSQSPLHSPPPPHGTIGVPNNQWPNSPVMSQSVKDYRAPNNHWNKQPSSSLDHSPLSRKTGNIGGVPNNRLSDPPVQPQSPKGYNQWNTSPSPVNDHPPPTRTTIGVPNSRLGNSSVKPQSPKVISSPYDKQIGNNIDFQSSKPVDYSYDHQPNEYGSNNGRKPSGYHSSPPRQSTAPLGKVANYIEEGMPNLKVTTGRSPDYLTGSQPRYSYPASEEPKQTKQVYVEYIDSAEAARRYGGRSFPARPDLKRSITSDEALERYSGTLVPN